ncbi:DEKNAAC102463 [Brettanomyces naardenensis]|uniref:Malate dehydrogenase n=1 Tax=Brettanomyces naardenensis TaxID=13370 RepID=A0A448YK48_BRENA|nr:DEKNAAC102463 [Brettanomyces naardenensis]
MTANNSTDQKLDKAVRVAVLGAAGGIGQPLSLTLKMNIHVKELSLYDVSPHVSGVAADLSHIDTPAKVSWHTPDNGGLPAALDGCDFVLVPAGVPRKPGMSRDDLFKINAGICAELASGIAQYCPTATVLVISNPVNSTVPVFAEVFKKNGTFNPRKLFGVTTLDSVRADTFIHEVMPDLNWGLIKVIGGHSGDTIVPLLSTVLGQDIKSLSHMQLHAINHRVQYGGDEIIQAKKGLGSSTLSMAYAAQKFFTTVLSSYLGLTDKNIACTFINTEFDNEALDGVNELKQIVRKLTGRPDLDLKYFAMPCVFGPNGIERVQYECLEHLDSTEVEMVKVCCETLPSNYSKGIDFVRGK